MLFWYGYWLYGTVDGVAETRIPVLLHTGVAAVGATATHTLGPQAVDVVVGLLDVVGLTVVGGAVVVSSGAVEVIWGREVVVKLLQLTVQLKHALS